MLKISETTLTGFQSQRRPQAVKELCEDLVKKYPRLASDETLERRVSELADWAAKAEIHLKFDVVTLADLTIGQNKDVVNDPDFRKVLADTPGSNNHIMLKYFESKPPGFWRNDL